MHVSDTAYNLEREMMMVKKVDHIGIAVRSIENALPFYIDTLNLTLEGIEELSSQHVRVAFIKVGDTKLELLEPTSEKSSVAKFIEKRGEGLHHVALAVNNIEERLEELKNKGIALIDEKPRVGAAQANIAFIHPKSTSGVLYEFCEKQRGEKND